MDFVYSGAVILVIDNALIFTLYIHFLAQCCVLNGPYKMPVEWIKEKQVLPKIEQIKTFFANTKSCTNDVLKTYLTELKRNKKKPHSLSTL